MATAASMKLIYFDFKGRAELIRLTLTLAGKPFEDMRIPRDQWPALKPTMPFLQMPVLEIDGKKHAQSLAIATYLAREFGLYGKTNPDAYKIDQIKQLNEDLMQRFSKFYLEKDAAKKAELEKNLKEVEAPRFLGYYERMLQENGTGYLVGFSLTLGDLVIFDACTGFMSCVVEGSVEKFPLVKALVETISNNDRLKPYLAARKKGGF